MIKRVFAWGIVATFCSLLFHYGANYTSPWARVTSSPVLSMLPLAGDGCGKACK